MLPDGLLTQAEHRPLQQHHGNGQRDQRCNQQTQPLPQPREPHSAITGPVHQHDGGGLVAAGGFHVEVSCLKAPQACTVSTEGMAGLAANSRFSSENMRCSSSVESHSSRRFAPSRFFAWRVIPAPLTLTWTPELTGWPRTDSRANRVVNQFTPKVVSVY